MAKKHHQKPKRRRRAHTALAAPRRRRVTRRHHSRRRSSKKGAGGVTVLQAVIAGAAIGYVTQNVPQVSNLFAAIPGAKTLGTPAAIGATALVVDRFLYRNKWVRIIGIGGLMMGAYQIGMNKALPKWVGDTSYDGIGDPDDGMISDVDD